MVHSYLVTKYEKSSVLEIKPPLDDQEMALLSADPSTAGFAVEVHNFGDHSAVWQQYFFPERKPHVSLQAQASLFRRVLEQEVPRPTVVEILEPVA